MSYARFAETCKDGRSSDVYVYGDVNDRKGEIRCCACTLLFPKKPRGGGYEGIVNFIAHSPMAMIEHLEEHASIGDVVPERAFKKLKLEARAFKAPKYPVHFAARGFIDPDGTKRTFTMFRYPACGIGYAAYYRKLLRIKKNEEGFAHPADEITRNINRVTCKHCKERVKKYGGYAAGTAR